MRRLRTARLRLEKAQAHRRRIAELWNGFAEGDEPYTTVVHVDDDGEGVIEIYSSPTMPRDEISLELGELLYQLRAALDSLVYELAIIDTGQNPPPNADKLEFPIRTSQAAFEHVRWKIAPLSQQHQRLIGALQPYAAAQQTDAMKMMAEALELLNDWARRDRHRSLHVVASWAANAQPLLTLPEGCTLDWLTIAPEGPLEQQSQVARFRLSGWQPHLDLEANPNLTIDVAIDEPLPPLPEPIRSAGDLDNTLSTRVKLLIGVVTLVVEGFEETLD